jgi:hypothetical protein
MSTEANHYHPQCCVSEVLIEIETVELPEHFRPLSGTGRSCPTSLDAQIGNKCLDSYIDSSHYISRVHTLFISGSTLL